MAANQMPRIDVPETEKTQAWGIAFLDYAQSLLVNYNDRRNLMTRLYRSYNGIKTHEHNTLWQKTYGKDNKAKYIAYRAGRTKINLLHGEWLKRPLSATVETINIQAKSEKMRQMDFMMGAMLAKDALNDLKEKAGVDVMEGAPIPDSEEDPIWKQMSFKDKCEDMMQIILNEGIKSLNLVQKLGEQFLDVCLTSDTFHKIEIDQNGDVQYIKIDPRDKIAEDIEGDWFYEKSTVKGARQRMPLHEVLSRWEFTDAERNKLQDLQNNYSSDRYKGNRSYTNNNGQFLLEIIHIEWKAMKPRYYKIAPKTKAQLEYDDTEKTVRIEISPEQYEKNKAAFDKEVASGKFVIETKWEEDLWEGTRIGGVINKDIRRKPFQMRRVDTPAYILDSSYGGLRVGVVDGVQISIQQTIENFDNIFDIIMYQILKELNKMKGKVLMYDRAALPKGKKMTDIAYDMTNDSFIDVNSSAAGNFSGRNLSGMELFKEFDLGLSQSVQQLFVLKEQILSTMDRLTGINEVREGAIQASATVANSQQSLENSRTQTAPIYYAFEIYTESVLMKICEAYKVSYAFYKREKGEQILGTERFHFLEVTEDIGFRDYGVHVQPGGKYMELKQRMRQWIEVSLNTKELHPLDALNFEMAETFAEAKMVFQDAYMKLQENATKQQQAEIQARQQMQQQQLEQQLQLNREQREDVQQHDLNKIAAEGEKDIMVDNNKAKNKMYGDQQNAENKFLQGQ